MLAESGITDHRSVPGRWPRKAGSHLLRQRHGTSIRIGTDVSEHGQSPEPQPTAPAILPAGRHPGAIRDGETSAAGGDALPVEFLTR